MSKNDTLDYLPAYRLVNYRGSVIVTDPLKSGLYRAVPKVSPHTKLRMSTFKGI
ncbi:hypothetical protein HMPREF9554_01957 [Treponema phagedenis F0421]|nr:hypothetical protein HMPREF9554_01957 [Treponema phagedenis F0421]